jgi:hypothetical protein
LSDVFTAAITTTASLKTEMLNAVNKMHCIYENSREMHKDNTDYC